MELAPLVLFVYNRPEHTKQTILALKKNTLAEKSELFIYSDGPKDDKAIQRVNETRNFLKNISGFKGVTIFESNENKGLAPSIIEGVTATLEKYDKAIILEDDLITSPFFLTFMNEGLEMYKYVSNVYSVNGYMFPIKTEQTTSVLLPLTSTWGWATWKDKWKAFDFDMKDKELISTNPYLQSRFNLADYDYTSMLSHGNNSWGIRWYYSVFIRNGLGVFPTKSLVENIGFDGSGINCIRTSYSTEHFQINNKIYLQHNTFIDLEIYLKIFEYFSLNKSKKNNSILFFINRAKNKLFKRS